MPKNLLFNINLTLLSEGAQEDQEITWEVENAWPKFYSSWNCAEDIDFVWNHGLKVDDDKNPAPENVPTSKSASSNNELNDGQFRVYDGIDQKAATVATDYHLSFQNN